MFALGFALGAVTAFGLCFWFAQWLKAQDRWWQENEGRRNARWPVLPPETEVHR